MLVGVNHTFDPITLRVEDIAVQSEAMLYLAVDFGSKAKCWDLVIRIVVLKNVSDGLDRLQILVLSVKVVQGFRALRVPVATCKVNRNRETDLAAAKDKVEEGSSLLDLEGTQRTSVFRFHLALLIGDLEISLTRLQHGKSELDVPEVCVLATFLRLVEFDLKLSFDFCCIHRHTSLRPSVAVVPHSDQF